MRPATRESGHSGTRVTGANAAEGRAKQGRDAGNPGRDEGREGRKYRHVWRGACLWRLLRARGRACALCMIVARLVLVLLCDEEVILRSGRARRARECLEGESCLRSAVRGLWSGWAASPSSSSDRRRRRRVTQSGADLASPRPSPRRGEVLQWSELVGTYRLRVHSSCHRAQCTGDK